MQGIPSIFLRDMTKEGWRLVADVPWNPLPIDQLELTSLLEPGGEYIPDDDMLMRAKIEGVLGQRQAEYCLEHQEEILEEWRSYYYIVFSGTVWQAPLNLRVPCLGWAGGRWRLWFDRPAWTSMVCFVRPKQPKVEPPLA